MLAALAGCSDPPEHLKTAEPGVVFTFPANGQVDVPTGARVVVSFSDRVRESAIGTCTATAGAICLVGPNGPVATTPVVSEDGYTVSFPPSQLEAGVKYDLFVRSELAPDATNLPASGPLVSFTTRTARVRVAAPTVVAINGGDPTNPESFRPMFESSTIRMVFSEPLDPRTVALGAGSFELLGPGGAAVPATIFANGIHVSIDPKDDLTAGTMYTLRVGTQVLDLGGQAMAASTFTLTPQRAAATPPIKQVLRTRQKGDPGPERSRSGANSNEIVIDKPLIGRETSTMLPTNLAAELGDPKALNGPIAFTIRKGQRLRSTGLDISLGGEIPVGLTTGDVVIELLTDAGGRLYRNPHQKPEQRPENARAPLYVDLSLDVAVYAEDPQGNAVLTQTVLGMQAVGTAIATDGVLAIETVGSMELGLMGVTTAPTNLVLELITDTAAAPPPADTTPPTFVASYPDQSEEHPVDDGVDLIFSEPIDLERARNGGLRLEEQTGTVVPTRIEGHGASVVLRPVQPLAYTRLYRVVFNDVADNAGNKLTQPNLSFTTATLGNTDVPMTVTAVHPGVPCALTGGTATSPGRCAGGLDADALYQPFKLPADDSVEISFTQPIRRTSVTLGTACGSGSVRIEEADMAGGCVRPVPGTLLVRDRVLEFVPDQPWVDGKQYRVVLNSGNDDNCDAGELCGPSTAASFDPLVGGENGEAGGPQLVIPFTGGPRSPATHMLAASAPFSDINGSWERDPSELERDENRAALRITGVTGDVTAASFQGPDCVPSTPETENCMYLVGSMPTDLGELTTSCGSTGAAHCIPAMLAPEAMYGTSTTMSATVSTPLGPITTNSETRMSVMRVREPAGGPVMGYVVDRNGAPTMVVTLDLYMDAPDMNVPLSDHDLHSKPLTVSLEGPMTFLEDGRIAISLHNTADLPMEVTITNFILSGTVKLLVPAGEMKLQLVSPPSRGRSL